MSFEEAFTEAANTSIEQVAMALKDNLMGANSAGDIDKSNYLAMEINALNRIMVYYANCIKDAEKP